MRLGEILNLNWRDIDFQSGFILIRDSKNGEARSLPLDVALTELFNTYPHRAGTDLIFSTPCGGRLTDIRAGFKNACRRRNKRSKVP
jgi:integrase